MKTCTRCKTEKELDFFNRRSKSPDGLSPWCKQCFADYDRERYQNGDKERKKRNERARVERMRELLWKILCSEECKACGNSDPEVLEFDHRDIETKSFNISEGLKIYSWEKIKAEIKKCDILCANCHRKRTIRQFGTWRGNRNFPDMV